MGYGGIDEVEIDDDYGYYYVHREGENGGYWNRYSIDGESSFLDFIGNHSNDIEISHLVDGEKITENELQELEEIEQDDFDDWSWR